MRLLAALLLALAGCSRTPEQTVAGVDINAAAAAAQNSIATYAATTKKARSVPAAAPVPPRRPPVPVTAPREIDPPAPGTPGGLPDDRTPIAEGPIVAGSAQDAANVVQIYYALIGERKYRRAWALWGHEGSDSGMTADAFAAGFARYAEYHANVGAPGPVDAGMSQRWVTVPVQVYGRLKTGAPVNMIGSVQLHRIVAGVSDVAADREWRIRSIDVKPRPGVRR